MAIRFDEFLANLERYKKALPADEPIVLPRREARRRVANKEKRRRIIFDTDELGYSRFHARRTAWLIELQDNVTLFNEALDEAMKTFDLRGWKEQREAAENQSLGDA